MANKLNTISPLGKKILQSIKAQGLTKKHVYEKLGISRGTLENWIYGSTAPDHNDLEAMSKILNINVLAKEDPVKESSAVKVLPMDAWELLQDDNKEFKKEISNLWDMVHFLRGQGIKTHEGK